MEFQDLKKLFYAFWRSDLGKRISKILQYFFVTVILGYLVYQLSEIGWMRVWQSLPVNPWFYVLFLILYFALPVSEQFIYGTSLRFSFWEGFRAFIQKKIYNTDVLGYSGEAYFFVWARKHLKESNSYILGIIKDNNIISSVASTLVAAVLLSIFLYIGQLSLRNLLNVGSIYFYGGMAAVGLAIIAFIYFRRYVISMPLETASKIFGIHILRLLFVYTVEIIQWMVVMPEVPVYIWLTYMSVKIISTRIPLLPSRDLLFIGASLEISKLLDVSGAGIAGILLASNVLSKLMNAALYAYLVISGRLKKEPDGEEGVIQYNIPESS